MDEATRALLHVAVQPLASNPELRTLLVGIKQIVEQLVDTYTKDVLLEAQGRTYGRERAKAVVEAFERYMAAYVVDHAQLRQRPRYDDLAELEAALRAARGGWESDALWEAYATVDASKVRRAEGRRDTVDLVSLMRYALHEADQLVPYADMVRSRFDAWMEAQATRGHAFTADERRWLEMMRDHVAGTTELSLDDFDLTPFREAGGVGRARMVFGDRLTTVVRELDEALAW